MMDIKYILYIFHYTCILHVMLLAVQIVAVKTRQCPVFFTQSSRSNQTISVSESDLKTCDLFYDLVHTLEKLHILTARDTSCYTLQDVFQTYYTKDPITNSQIVEISFRFQENFKTTDKFSVDKISSTVCNKGNHDTMKAMNDSESDKGNTSLALAKSSRYNEDTSVLSHTQVVVIATCSAVIGTFFILAAALRIRNYIKRVREEQQAARRSNNYRLPLSKGAQPLDEHSRKSSSASRSSQQNILLDKDGSSCRNSGSPSACRLPLLNTMPRLIVTAPSTAPSTPGDSHSSIQFIDEETENIQGNDDVINQTDKKEENVRKSIETTDTTIDDESHTQETDENDALLATNADKRSTEINIGRCESSQDNPTEVYSLLEMQSVNIGLTQSDDSLSSHNASYCYGNQVEYAVNGGYGNVGYCPPMENEAIVENDEGNHNKLGEGNLVDTNDKHFPKCFCDNDTATSFELDEIKGTMKDKIIETRAALMDSHNIISLDQFEQRRKLQRQDRTLTQTMSFETDAF